MNPTPHRSLSLARAYFTRALRLRCPECGNSPVFPPLKEMRGPSDLFTTLKDCPVCRYVYDREEGYFLIATWAFSYGLGAMIALGIYLYMEYWLNASLSRMLWTILPIVMLVNLLTARHARSLWLAVDHFFDPQACWRDDGGDNEGMGTCPAPPVERPALSQVNLALPDGLQSADRTNEVGLDPERWSNSADGGSTKLIAVQRKPRLRHGQPKEGPQGRTA